MAAFSHEIKLNICKPINESFLRWVFDCNKEGPITISRKNEIGKYIYSRVRLSNIPQKQSEGVQLILPDTDKTNPENYFLYFTADDQSKINDFLDSNFQLFFHLSMLKGSLLGIPFRKKYEALINELKLNDDLTVYEKFKKADYRKRKSVSSFMFKPIKHFDNQ